MQGTHHSVAAIYNPEQNRGEPEHDQIRRGEGREWPSAAPGGVWGAGLFAPQERRDGGRKAGRQLEVLEGVFVPVPQGGTERARAGWFARSG